jgi:prepilin-type processing-associated H-X9-DG protein
LLWGYFETPIIFKCPEEAKWQCGYGMNYSTGSPMAQRDSFVTATSERIIVWDHRRSPGCADSRIGSPPRPPWVPFDAVSHYPPRHGGRFNGLFYDGHVTALRSSDLNVKNFREPNFGPPVAGYPGE